MVKSCAEKSFVVIDGDLRPLLEYEAGWYTVSSLDIRGLNTQGKTIEEAIENAHDAAKLLAEYRTSEIREVKAAGKRVGSRKRMRTLQRTTARTGAPAKAPVKA